MSRREENESPPSVTDLYRKVEEATRRRGRRTDEVEQAERLARLGQWRSMPLTVGLAAALLAGGWHIWTLRDRLAREIRHEIQVHNRDYGAHATRIGDVREAWRRCLDLEREVRGLRDKFDELSERRKRQRRRR